MTSSTDPRQLSQSKPSPPHVHPLAATKVDPSYLLGFDGAAWDGSALKWHFSHWQPQTLKATRRHQHQIGASRPGLPRLAGLGAGGRTLQLVLQVDGEWCFFGDGEARGEGIPASRMLMMQHEFHSAGSAWLLKWLWECRRRSHWHHYIIIFRNGAQYTTITTMHVANASTACRPKGSTGRPKGAGVSYCSDFGTVISRGLSLEGGCLSSFMASGDVLSIFCAVAVSLVLRGEPV